MLVFSMYSGLSGTANKARAPSTFTKTDNKQKRKVGLIAHTSTRVESGHMVLQKVHSSMVDPYSVCSLITREQTATKEKRRRKKKGFDCSKECARGEPVGRFSKRFAWTTYKYQVRCTSYIYLHVYSTVEL